ncbi:MAG: PIN domain-containing protein [Thermoanaerobaculia bacterium]
MIDRLAVDANVIVALIRRDQAEPPLDIARELLLPLPVVGELFAGAHYSKRVTENLTKVEEILAVFTIVHPDIATSRVYGALRGSTGRGRITSGRMNDLWIAALCIQHAIPLLTNDRGFDAIAGLTVIHW